MARFRADVTGTHTIVTVLILLSFALAVGVFRNNPPDDHRFRSEGSSYVNDGIAPNSVHDAKQIIPFFERAAFGGPENNTPPRRHQIFDHTIAGERGDGNEGDPAFSWSEAGPNYLGGRTRTISVDVSNSETIIAGGVSGGIWKSTDSGMTWRLVSEPGNPVSVTAIAQDPRPGHQNTWYAAGGEFDGSGGSFQNFRDAEFGSGIWKSTDNGDSWSLIDGTTSGDPNIADFPFDYVSELKVSPITGTVFVATHTAGLYRSVDGVQFENVLGAPFDNRFVDFDLTSDGDILATLSTLKYFGGESAAGGVYISRDDGSTWVNITRNEFPQSHSRSAVAVAPSNPNAAYILSLVGRNNATGYDQFTFFKIDLDTGNLQDRSGNLPQVPGILAQGAQLHSYNGYALVLRVKPDNEDFIVFGGLVLYRSFDGLATKPQTYSSTRIGGYECAGDGAGCVDPVHGSIYPNHWADQHEITFDPSNPNKVWSGHDGGISVSDDVTAIRVSWDYRNLGYNTAQLYSAAMTDDAGDGRLAGGLQDAGVQYVRDRNGSGVETDFTDGERLTYDDGGFVQFTDNYLVVGLLFGKLKRLNYSNAAQSEIRSELERFNSMGSIYPDIRPAGATGFKWPIHPFIIDPTDEKTLFYPDGSTSQSGATIWRNSDINAPNVSQNWSRLNNLALPFGWLYTAFEFSREPAHRLYLGASAVTVVQDVPRLYRFDNADESVATPVELALPDAPKGSFVHDIAVNPENADELLVVLSNYNLLGLFHSTDAGQTFEQVEGNLEGEGGMGPSLRSATILPLTKFGSSGTFYFVGTSIGLFSTQGMQGSNTVWVKESSDLIGGSIVNHVSSRASDARVLVGTHGRGLFVGDLDQTSIATEDPLVPEENHLSITNYPNPFVDRTGLSFTLPSADHVSLMIYDVSGRLVRSLVDAYLPAGEHHESLDMRALSSGVYVAVLRSGKASTARQIVKVK